MKVTINYQKQTDKKLEYLISLLPEEIRDFLYCYIKENDNFPIDELRLHSNSYMCLISSFKNIKTSFFVTQEHIESILLSFCQGSVYSHFNTIREGYINLGQGIRVGICGKATIQNGNITGVRDFNSLNIRMPKRIYGAGDHLFDILLNDRFLSSVLLYSSPGVGKTSILRELICKLSDMSEPIRVSVIDSREELIAGIENNVCVDFFLAYPKEQAISFATRTMTPQIIICDEISTQDEANAILHSANCGVTFVATTHASGVEELKQKEILKPLFLKNIFKYALGVSRQYGSKKYEYTLNTLAGCLL